MPGGGVGCAEQRFAPVELHVERQLIDCPPRRRRRGDGANMCDLPAVMQAECGGAAGQRAPGPGHHCEQPGVSPTSA